MASRDLWAKAGCRQELLADRYDHAGLSSVMIPIQSNPPPQQLTLRSLHSILNPHATHLNVTYEPTRDSPCLSSSSSSISPAL
jgi:hypothetical protein